MALESGIPPRMQHLISEPISRRDFFTGCALIGLLAKHGDEADVATLADIAVAHADTALAALAAASDSIAPPAGTEQGS